MRHLLLDVLHWMFSFLSVIWSCLVSWCLCCSWNWHWNGQKDDHCVSSCHSSSSKCSNVQCNPALVSGLVCQRMKMSQKLFLSPIHCKLRWLEQVDLHWLCPVFQPCFPFKVVLGFICESLGVPVKVFTWFDGFGCKWTFSDDGWNWTFSGCCGSMGFVALVFTAAFAVVICWTPLELMVEMVLPMSSSWSSIRMEAMVSGMGLSRWWQMHWQVHLRSLTLRLLMNLLVPLWSNDRWSKGEIDSSWWDKFWAFSESASCLKWVARQRSCLRNAMKLMITRKCQNAFPLHWKWA